MLKNILLTTLRNNSTTVTLRLQHHHRYLNEKVRQSASGTQQSDSSHRQTDKSNTSGDGGALRSRCHRCETNCARSEENKLNVLPGTKGTSWPWASLSRTMMTRGVAPDHVPRILVLTVLASLGINLGEKRYEIQQVLAEFSS